MDTANAHRDTLLQMKEALTAEQRESLARWQTLAEDVKEMGVDGVKALKEAREKLDEALREIAALKGVRQELENQVAVLRQAAQVNLDTANYANGSVKKALTGPIKSFFSHPEQIFGLMCIAAIARHVYQLST